LNDLDEFERLVRQLQGRRLCGAGDDCAVVAASILFRQGAGEFAGAVTALRGVVDELAGALNKLGSASAWVYDLIDALSRLSRSGGGVRSGVASRFLLEAKREV